MLYLLTAVHLELFVLPGGFLGLLASGVKLQTFAVSVTVHKHSTDPNSEQQKDLLQRFKERSFYSVEVNQSGLPQAGSAVCFYSLI